MTTGLRRERWGGRIPSPRSVLDFFLPPACAGCRAPLPRGSGGGRVCPGCLTRIRPIPSPGCPRCGAPRGTGLPADRICPECEGWSPFLRTARAAAVLAPPADDLVHALKYEGWRELAGTLAERMVRPGVFPVGVAPGTPVLPVPTTPERARRRGYNQATLLAREVAERCDFPFVEGMSRNPGKGSQVALHREERRANVSGAFLVLPEWRSALSGRDVILVDDVLTTGATASAVADTLGEAGVTSVTLLVFARALPGHDGRTPS